MLTIKRQLPTKQPTIEYIAKLVQRGKENGLSTNVVSEQVFLEFNKPPSYETFDLRIGQKVKIVNMDRMCHDVPSLGDICIVSRINIDWTEGETVVQVEICTENNSDYNTLDLSEVGDVSEHIQLV